MPGKPLKPLEITPEERHVLERFANGRAVAHALAVRAQIILGCASGRMHREIAADLRTSMQTVGMWRKRFAERRLEGLADLPRPNVHLKLEDERVAEVIRVTLQATPKGATHWSTRKLAKEVGVSQSSVSRVWRAFQLKPHRQGTFTLSNDVFFVEKVHDIVGLYMNPPDHAVVLCLDEKSQIQALERRQPILPNVFGAHERVTATYRRNGITNLFAALDVATGKVIGACYPRKRAVEFRRFLASVDREVPAKLDVHLVVDNSSIHGAPEVQRWLKRHPRFRMHFTPTYSSWMNLVERWFGRLTDEALRRGNHRNTRELEDAIAEYVGATNDAPKPFVWTKTADQILASVARFCARALHEAEG
jgi:transposase